MNDNYAEAGVKRRQIPQNYAIRVLMIVLIIAVLLIGPGLPVIGGFAMFIDIALIAVCVFWFPLMNVEYEYVYVDGQLDFDRISGGRKRKTIKRVDFDKVEIIAPYSSHALDAFNNNPKVKVLNFSSYNPQTQKTSYCLIFRDEELYKIIFEPTEKMIKTIELKYPRKIAQY
jgi:hypothetical protein